MDVELDDLMIGVGNGVLEGPAINNNYASNNSMIVSENCFSTYNTPKFKQGYEAFPKFLVKRNPLQHHIITSDVYNDEMAEESSDSYSQPTSKNSLIM